MTCFRARSSLPEYKPAFRPVATLYVATSHYHQTDIAHRREKEERELAMRSVGHRHARYNEEVNSER